MKRILTTLASGLAIASLVCMTAGPDRVVVLAGKTYLSGELKTAGKPSGVPADVMWSKSSGWGEAVFADAHAPATTATFSAVGEYVLKLTSCGGAIGAEETLVGKFEGKRHPPTTETVYRSQDHGKSWSPVEVEIKPDSKGHKPEMHMNEHGITLRRGEHRGRLLRPARYYGKQNSRDEWPNHYTTAIYSDDGGKVWRTSEPDGVLQQFSVAAIVAVPATAERGRAATAPDPAPSRPFRGGLTAP